MIQWVIEGVLQSSRISSLWVATDSLPIADLCKRLNVPAVMTDKNCPSGSDRVFQAVEKAPQEFILNIQGDEPLIDGPTIDTIAEFMASPEHWTW